jgi:hypothetical protein
MSEQTLKELLKMPFEFDNNLSLCLGDNFILDVLFKNWDTEEDNIVAVKKFVEQALNEKRERDFGEPMRWKMNPEELLVNQPWCECPKCGLGRYGKPQPHYHYCPSCGQRLLSPEEGVKDERRN